MKILLILPLLLLLGGCLHTRQQTPITVSNYCQIAKPITWQDGDSYLTARQIDAHNRTYKNVCKRKT